jgi:hypothetical protein
LPTCTVRPPACPRPALTDVGLLLTPCLVRCRLTMERPGGQEWNLCHCERMLSLPDWSKRARTSRRRSCPGSCSSARATPTRSATRRGESGSLGLWPDARGLLSSTARRRPGSKHASTGVCELVERYRYEQHLNALNAVPPGVSEARRGSPDCCRRRAAIR